LPELRRRALLALGSALVHGVRGRDGEGAGVLHQAIEASDQTRPDPEAAKAHRELGYVEMLRGRYDRARVWLERATPLAGGIPAEAAWINAVEGVVEGDVGRHATAIETLELALRLARESGERSAEAWALTFIGRGRLVRNELEAAREALGQALALVRDIRWTSFLPIVEAFLAEVQLRQGETQPAADALEHAYALSLQLGDPCWEGIAGRGLGLVAEQRGNVDEAMRWLSEARIRCVRLPDAWLWVEGYCLDALCSVAVEHHLPQAEQLIEDLEDLSARTGMRELVAHAYRHRASMGDTSAADALTVLRAEVENPARLGS
jgi:tetratricopeptide (TPR) repeat protein